MVNERSLYASGLGLLISSAGGLSRLRDGRNYYDADPNDEQLLKELMDNHELVILQTGSPQLDYRIVLHREPMSASKAQSLIGAVDVSLRVRGGELVVRDGYDLDNWTGTPGSAATFSVVDGLYDLHIAWEPCAQHALMILHFCLIPASDVLAGDGNLELFYDPRRRG